MSTRIIFYILDIILIKFLKENLVFPIKKLL